MTGKRYKATNISGFDFYTGEVDYAAALASGELIVHPNPYMRALSGRPYATGSSPTLPTRNDAARYFSVATVPTDCTGMRWPCRLFEVETVDEWVPEPRNLPNKRASISLRVVAELDAVSALGPQGPQLVALFKQIRSATPEQLRRVSAARGAARGAAWDAAWDAARDAAAAARGAAWDAAWDAARALVVRDLITDEQYQTLAGPWISVFGEVQA